MICVGLFWGLKGFASPLEAFFEGAEKELKAARPGQPFTTFITRDIDYDQAMALVDGTGHFDRSTFYVTQNGSPDKPLVKTTNLLSFALYCGKYNFLSSVFSKKNMDGTHLFPVDECFQGWVETLAFEGYRSFFWCLSNPVQKEGAYHHDKHMKLIKKIGQNFLNEARSYELKEVREKRKLLFKGLFFTRFLNHDESPEDLQECERQMMLLKYFSYLSPDLDYDPDRGACALSEWFLKSAVIMFFQNDLPWNSSEADARKGKAFLDQFEGGHYMGCWQDLPLHPQLVRKMKAYVGSHLKELGQKLSLTDEALLDEFYWPKSPGLGSDMYDDVVEFQQHKVISWFLTFRDKAPFGSPQEARELQAQKRQDRF